MLQNMSKLKTVFPLIPAPSYTGAAVYALVDENGKRYIGSTNNIQRRLKTHNQGIRDAITCGRSAFSAWWFVNAIKAGHTFTMEILEQIPPGTTRKEREAAERRHLQASGGLDATYNDMPV